MTPTFSETLEGVPPLLGQVSIKNQTTHKRNFSTHITGRIKMTWACPIPQGMPKPTRYAQAHYGEAEFKFNSL